jgi:hypothetical protein
MISGKNLSIEYQLRSDLLDHHQLLIRQADYFNGFPKPNGTGAISLKAYQLCQ